MEWRVPLPGILRALNEEKCKYYAISQSIPELAGRAPRARGVHAHRADPAAAHGAADPALRDADPQGAARLQPAQLAESLEDDARHGPRLHARHWPIDVHAVVCQGHGPPD